MKTPGITLLAAALVLVADAGSNAANAQANDARGRRVAVTVVLVDRLAVPDAPFILQRRPALTPNDVILLPSTATAAQLSDAVHTVLAARQAGGDFPTRAGIVRMRTRQKPGRAGKAFPWAELVLSDLHVAQPQEIAGVGRVPAVVIWLPPQRPTTTRAERAT